MYVNSGARMALTILSAIISYLKKDACMNNEEAWEIIFSNPEKNIMHKLSLTIDMNIYLRHSQIGNKCLGIIVAKVQNVWILIFVTRFGKIMYDILTGKCICYRNYLVRAP